MRTGRPPIDPTDLLGQQIGTLAVQAVLGYQRGYWLYTCQCTACGAMQTRTRTALLQAERSKCCWRGYFPQAEHPQDLML